MCNKKTKQNTGITQTGRAAAVWIAGACCRGRLAVPFARLIEACLPRKHKSAFSRDIRASLGQDGVRLVRTALALICGLIRLGSRVFTTV